MLRTDNKDSEQKARIVEERLNQLESFFVSSVQPLRRKENYYIEVLYKGGHKYKIVCTISYFEKVFKRVEKEIASQSP